MVNVFGSTFPIWQAQNERLWGLMTQEIVTRTALTGDIPALHRLIESAYRGDSAKRGWTHEADLLGGQRTDPDKLAEVIADDQHHLLVAEQDGAIIGCVDVMQVRDGVCYLGLLTVDPTLQANGLGRQLIAAAEGAAVEHFGAGRMEMTVIKQREELIAYYVRRGYVLTGETRPFPMADARFGLPKTRELEFVVLEKVLG